MSTGDQTVTPMTVVDQATPTPNAMPMRVALFDSAGAPISRLLDTVPSGAEVVLTGYSAGSAGDPLATDTVNAGLAKVAATADAAAPLLEKVNTVAAAGATNTIPAPSTATMHNVTLTANCTFTFPTATAGRSFTLALTQGGSGSYTVTWPAAVKWAGGTAPTLSTSVGKVDYLKFVCVDGATWAGRTLGLDVR